MIKNREPSAESLGSSHENLSNLRSSKRQKWKNKIMGSSQDSSEYGVGSSRRSKKTSMQRLSFGVPSGSKRHRRTTLVSSDGAKRAQQSLFITGKSSAHEFTIPEKVNEENNEETENEDVKNDSELRKQKSKILNSYFFDLKPTDDHVGGPGAGAAAGDDHKDLQDALRYQHRDSMEDTK